MDRQKVNQECTKTVRLPDGRLCTIRYIPGTRTVSDDGVQTTEIQRMLIAAKCVKRRNQRNIF